MSSLIEKRRSRLALVLLSPALVLIALVTFYPIGLAIWDSLHSKSLTSQDSKMVWLDNYVSVLGSSYWWKAVLITLVITFISVTFEFILGLLLALVMHHTRYFPGLIRTIILVPYALVTAVSAYSWFYAWTPGVGYLANLFPEDYAPLAHQSWALFIIIVSEIWKTTPFMSLLLLAGLTQVPQDVLMAAEVDGATRLQKLTKVILPMMKPAIAVALLFRTLEAIRIFDNIYIITRGSNNTYSVAILGYDNLFKAFNVGVGSAISVLIFLLTALLVLVVTKFFGSSVLRVNANGK